MKQYYDRLRETREDKDLTQTQVANAIGMKHYTQYRRYETGETKLYCETLKKICQYLDVSADYILGLSDK